MDSHHHFARWNRRAGPDRIRTLAEQALDPLVSGHLNGEGQGEIPIPELWRRKDPALSPTITAKNADRYLSPLTMPDLTEPFDVPMGNKSSNAAPTLTFWLSEEALGWHAHSDITPVSQQKLQDRLNDFTRGLCAEHHIPPHMLEARLYLAGDALREKIDYLSCGAVVLTLSPAYINKLPEIRETIVRQRARGRREQQERIDRGEVPLASRLPAPCPDSPAESGRDPAKRAEALRKFPPLDFLKARRGLVGPVQVHEVREDGTIDVDVVDNQGRKFATETLEYIPEFSAKHRTTHVLTAWVRSDERDPPAHPSAEEIKAATHPLITHLHTLSGHTAAGYPIIDTDHPEHPTLLFFYVDSPDQKEALDGFAQALQEPGPTLERDWGATVYRPGNIPKGR